jgi:plastocyanin
VPPTALVTTDRKEKQMKDKILTLADRMLIRTTIVSAFVAAVVAVGTPAQAGLRRAAADATHRVARATTIRVSTHNARFVLSARTAKRGVVIFKVSNPSPIVHNFSINGRTTRLLKTGQSATLRVTFRRKGRYPYKDTFDHHAQFGERGVLTIT